MICPSQLISALTLLQLPYCQELPPRPWTTRPVAQSEKKGFPTVDSCVLMYNAACVYEVASGSLSQLDQTCDDEWGM